MTIFKGERFYNDLILDICTHFKPTETFQYTHFSSCHAPGVRKDLSKAEHYLRILRTNSSKTTFEENIKNFRSHLRVLDYPGNLVDKFLAEFKLSDRKSHLSRNRKKYKTD